MLSSEKHGIQVSVETTSALVEAVNLYQKGIAAFSGLEHTFSLVTLKDTGATTQSHYSRDSVSILSRAGKVSITSENYMKIIETFKPDFFHTLCDGDTNHSCGNKRIFNAVHRTDTFFKECATLYESLTSLSDSMLIGNIWTCPHFVVSVERSFFFEIKDAFHFRFNQLQLKVDIVNNIERLR